MMCRFRMAMAVLSLSVLLGCGDDDPTDVQAPKFSEGIDSTFAVDDSSTLTVQNFVGTVDVRPGAAGTLRVVATKWAPREANLAQILVTLVEVPGGVNVVTTAPPELKNVSVDLDITVPADTRPTVQAGVGSISYVGPAEGDSFFQTGVGSIDLALPADVNIEVVLATGVGSVTVEF